MPPVLAEGLAAMTRAAQRDRFAQARLFVRTVATERTTCTWCKQPVWAGTECYANAFPEDGARHVPCEARRAADMRRQWAQEAQRRAPSAPVERRCGLCRQGQAVAGSGLCEGCKGRFST